MQPKMSTITNMDMEENDEILNDTEKKKKPGIIYLSTLPPFMNVTKVKDIFGAYGTVGRVFLQPADKFEEDGVKKKKKKKTFMMKKKPSKHFSEGWIEFERKKIAKRVAAHLNNTLIGGKKKSKFYDYTWNIKYLPRFKWVHLSERLAYERAVYQQKMRNEISQVKREANFYKNNLEKSQRLLKYKMLKAATAPDDSCSVSKDDKTEYSENSVEDRTEFLKSIFSSVK